MLDLPRTAATYMSMGMREAAAAFLRTYLSCTPGIRRAFQAYMLLDRLILWTYLQRHEPERIRLVGSFRA